ncbi:MAG TPA: hypothetical protein V6D11_14910 [Waterburya sp.]
MPETDPRIKFLARRAAKRIKALRTENEQEIEAIYRHFRRQYRAIKAEASAGELEPLSTGPDQTTEANQS